MTQLERLLELLSDEGIWRMTSLSEAGVSTRTVRHAVLAGVVERVSRGVYRRSGVQHVAGIHLAEALVRVPQGVICLHSAAAEHGLGDETSTRTWVAIPHAATPSVVEWPPIRYVRWRGTLPFEVGVDTTTISGVEVRDDKSGPHRD